MSNGDRARFNIFSIETEKQAIAIFEKKRGKGDDLNDKDSLDIRVFTFLCVATSVSVNQRTDFSGFIRIQATYVRITYCFEMQLVLKHENK